MLNSVVAPSIRFPFRLSDAFFTTLELRRVPELPEPLELKLNVEARVDDSDFPDKLQTSLRIMTQGKRSPFKVCIELIGLFERVQGQPEPDRSIIQAFINERAFFILWPYVEQIIRQTTGLMGMQPVKIKNPYYFDFKPPRGPAESPEVQEINPDLLSDKDFSRVANSDQT